MADPPFISSFCDTSQIPEHFRGMLGRFTPCFTDVVVLGSAHLTAILLCIARLAQLRRGRGRQFRLRGTARGMHAAAALLAAACLLVVLFQLNARLAADATPLVSGRAAPFEWAGYSLALLSWSLFLAIFLVELGRYSPASTWLWRFPIFLVFAGQLAKLKFVVELSAGERTYFFYLFLAYVGLQGALAAVAALHFPAKDDLEETDSADGYLPLAADVDAGTQAAEGRHSAEDDPCPEPSAGLLSRLSFTWMRPLLVKGYRAPLRFEDVWSLPQADTVATVGDKFQREWAAELAAAGEGKQPPSLIQTCWRCTRRLFLTAVPWKLMADLAQFVGPTFLKLLLGVVSGEGGPQWQGYAYAGAMLLGLLAGVIADNQQFQLVMRAGFHLRSMLTHAVYRKLLFMAPTARAQFTSGRLYSAVGSDVDSIQQLCMNLLGVLSSPLRVVGALVLLHAQLGNAAWVTLGILAALMPVQAFMVRKAAGFTRSSLQYTDERGKLEGELVGGIDVVKCYAWEDSFLARVVGARASELAGLWKAAIVSSFNTTIILTVPVLAALGSFGAYSLLSDTPLTAAQVPLFQLPMLVNALVSARVAAGRLQAILASEEQPPLAALPPAAPGEAAVRVEGEFSWDADSPPTLVDLKFEAPAGALVAVVGSTGSGKSSLLAAALGLMHQVAGPPPQLRGNAAYVPQAAFIVNDTVRANILFGAQYEEGRYRQAVAAASLEHDLQQLPAGDLTELGDRGVNVSGGQKQRIALARAVYAHADVLLLDDPLSALDAKVGRCVFRDCIAGALAGKTRVLVTNQLQFVGSADLVAYMQDGQVAEFGRYDELMAAGDGFATAMAQAQTEAEDATASEAGEPAGDAGDDDANGVAADSSGVKGAGAPPAAATAAAAAPAAVAPGQGRLTAEEGRSQGALSAAVIWAYVAAMGGLFIGVAVIGALCAVEVARISAQLWLQHWTSDVDATHGDTPHPTLWYLGIYSAIALSQIVLTFSGQFFLRGRALAAADTLHLTMLRSLLRAPMAFFNTTPLGRIVNRLTKDTADIDRQLPDFVSFYLRSILQLTSTLALVAALNPFTLWALTPCLLGFWLLFQYFQATVREVKRLDAVSRSPLYGCVGEAAGGIASIRAYRSEARLEARCAALLDRNIVTNLVNQSANRWLSIRLEGLGACAAFAAAVLAVEQRGAAALLGNILSSALMLTQLTSMTVRGASLAEQCFNAVERVDEYCHLPQEAAPVVPGSIPPGWPSKGEIKVEAVRMRYRPGLPLVLKGLSCDIPGGSTCGVVGRTGAGKSSLINALFRLVELDGGSILLDGVNTSRVGLVQLRGGMALIPQSPVLFTGTIRFNLSPFGHHSDAELWGALRRAHLAPAIQASPLGLDMVISEGGAPLSAGQRQLLALARGLLKAAKVLVLDEASAFLDLETDALIQKTVRTEFASCTVVAIAHRLHTIIDADNVLVMDAGRAAEFGPPAQLLSRPDGIFSDMVKETGEATERLLRQLAAGEAAAQGSLEAAAQHALKRLETAPREGGLGLLPGECAYRLSKELEGAAAAAAAAVHAALAALRENEEEGGEEEGPPVVAAAVCSSLQSAFLLVEQVRELAEQARCAAPRPLGSFGRSAHDAAPALGSPAGAAAGLAERRSSFAAAAEEERAPLLHRLSSHSRRRAASPSGGEPQLERRSSPLERGLSGLGRVLGGLAAGAPGGRERRRLLKEDPSIATNPSLQ